MANLRTLLILGRVSNLPTVWSNCLAGWWLGGAGLTHNLPWLLAGATLLYMGGMFLNDAFDAAFDTQYRRERPIPSGAIARQTVWWIGFGLLAAGTLCFAVPGRTTLLLAMLLAACILLYDAVHKAVSFSPVIMALCRWLLYVVSASVAAQGVTGWALWCGLALAVYIVGLSYLARGESTRGVARFWPCYLLGTPVALALLMNTGEFLRPAALLSVILALWVVRSLRSALDRTQRNMGRAVSGLLAGIVLVDLLAVADAPRELGLVFIALFLASLFFQRFIPAT